MQPVASYAARLMLVTALVLPLMPVGEITVCAMPVCPPPHMPGGSSVTALRGPGPPTTLYSAVLSLSSLDDSRAFRKRPLKSSSTHPQTAPGPRRTTALMPAQEVMVARLRLFALTIVAIPYKCLLSGSSGPHQARPCQPSFRPACLMSFVPRTLSPILRIGSLI